MTKFSVPVTSEVEIDLTVALRDKLVGCAYKYLKDDRSNIFSVLREVLNSGSLTYGEIPSDILEHIETFLVKTIVWGSTPSDLDLEKREYHALRELAEKFHLREAYAESKEFFLSVFYLTMSERFQDYARELLMVGEAYDELILNKKDA